MRIVSTENKTLFELLKDKIHCLLNDIQTGLKPHIEKVTDWEIYYQFPGGIEVRIIEPEGSWRPYFLMKSKQASKIRMYTRPIICDWIVDDFQVETVQDVDLCITRIKNELTQESSTYFTHGKRNQQEL